MKVYTIQHWKVVERLTQKEKIFSDKRFICDYSFKAAYQWYLSEAKSNCPEWEGERPFWVWIKRPDLRYWKHFKDNRRQKTEEMALIELEIPDSLILISDFMFWHFVLNQRYLPYSEKDDEQFDAQAKNRDYEHLPLNLKRKVENSWKRCLLLNKKSFTKFDENFLDKEQVFQGIIPFLHKGHVKSIKYFNSYNLKE